MKSKILLFAIIGSGLITISSCGPKSVKGADGKEYDTYQSACRNHDFVAAYDWIEKNDGSEDDKDYVFNAEMLYLTSLGTEEAENRIVYLLAEYQIPGTPPPNEATVIYEWKDSYKAVKNYIEGVTRFNKRCDNVLDMAIAQGKMELAKKILNLYKDDINRGGSDEIRLKEPTFLPTSKNAAKTRYFSILKKNAEKSGDFSELDSFISQEGFTMKDEMIISYLASRKEKSASDAIIKAISQVTISGRPMSKGLHNYYDGKRGYHEEVSEPHFQYTDGIVDYNNDCDRILGIAIGAGNQYLAQKILVCFKQNIETMTGSDGAKAPDGTKVDDNHSYVYYTNVDQNNAQKKYQEAVRNGAFK